MRVPILSALHLLKLIQSGEFPDVLRKTSARLERLGHDGATLSDLVSKLESLELELAREGESIRAWPTLSEEFATFFSWLLLDMSSSVTSFDFNSALRLSVATRLNEKYKQEDQKISDHDVFLQILGWVVGCPISWLQEECGVVFPLRTLNLWEDEASLAYRGLIQQVQLIDVLEPKPGDSNADRDVQHEMIVSSLPLRIVGLAEALVDPLLRDKVAGLSMEDAVTKRIQKLRGPVRSSIEKNWEPRSENLKNLHASRNSIAHIWSRENSDYSFAQALNSLNLEYVYSLGRLASYFMAANIAEQLDSMSDRRVGQWLEQMNRELDNHLEGR